MLGNWPSSPIWGCIKHYLPKKAYLCTVQVYSFRGKEQVSGAAAHYVPQIDTGYKNKKNEEQKETKGFLKN